MWAYFKSIYKRRNSVLRKRTNFIRYPGGKQRFVNFICGFLPSSNAIRGRFVEPFVGSGAVFFALSPSCALLADINPVLTELYKGLRDYPLKIWEIFRNFPSTKEAYYHIRDGQEKGDLPFRAAKTLYLNRTCFKGMWRQNSNGKFNVGYGGQDRRWVINKDTLLTVSKYLKRAEIRTCDFEDTINSCNDTDFLFIDPPYLPGKRELVNSHYIYSQFTFEDHKRLAYSLKEASNRNIKWAITISSHIDIKKLFRGNRVIPFIKGTGKKPGLIQKESGEVLICNY